MGFAISSVYHYVHEEGTRTHVSPSVSTNAKQEDLVYFTQAERELLDHAAELERRSISSFVANDLLMPFDRGFVQPAAWLLL